MTILTRENLTDGSYLSKLSLSPHVAWTGDDLQRSLSTALELRPEGDLWVFGYGSLMWNPLMEFDARQLASLDGWHRSFSVRSISGRGSPEHPGRVLSLEPGGQVQGVAFRLRPDLAEAELRLLWTREMAGGVYHPLWLDLTLVNGQAVRAITFVANVEHPQYEPDASVETVAKLVAKATGAFGPNIDYNHALDRALADLGLQDPYIEAIVLGLRQQAITADRDRP